MNDADAIGDDNGAEQREETSDAQDSGADKDSSDPREDATDSTPPNDSNRPEPADTTPPPEPTLEEQLAAARADTRAVREKMLRVAADFDNYRKRSARELEDARRRGQQSTVRELLAVFDNLERATQQVTETTDPKTVAQGVRMVLKLFVDTLARLGIERIESLGKAFDPGLHDGMQHIHSDEHPAGAVAQELQPGYRMGRELIRPALVVVSKGPEPAEDPAEEPAQEPAHEPAQEPAPETADDATETVESEAPEEGTGSDPSA